MQLSAQSIHEHCEWGRIWAHKPQGWAPMISPFSQDRVVIRGRSAGLSSASYDVRIASDLTLGPQPQFTIARALTCRVPGEPAAHTLDRLWHDLREWSDKPPMALAHTLESFAMPINVVGYVVDKSSHARLFVSAFNTLLDPGWRGNLTLELVNLSDQPIVLHSGDPICQIAFHFLDRETDRPYQGKYQDQLNKPVGAIFEDARSNGNEDCRPASSV